MPRELTRTRTSSSSARRRRRSSASIFRWWVTSWGLTGPSPDRLKAASARTPPDRGTSAEALHRPNSRARSTPVRSGRVMGTPATEVTSVGLRSATLRRTPCLDPWRTPASRGTRIVNGCSGSGASLPNAGTPQMDAALTPPRTASMPRLCSRPTWCRARSSGSPWSAYVPRATRCNAPASAARARRRRDRPCSAACPTVNVDS